MNNIEAHVAILGRTARDRITGFIGVVSSVGFDLYGCVQAAITPPLDKDGKLVEGRWFDTNRLELVGEERAMPLPQYAAPETFAYGPAEKPARDR
jgi:hypothetical protein